MAERRLNLRSWIYRVLTWDALLPVVFLLIPVVIAQKNPNNFRALEVAAVCLPLIAFLIRAKVGRDHIASNQCQDWLKEIQYFVFFVGILCLMAIDLLVILVPMGDLLANPDDRLATAILYLAYLTMMVI